MLEKNAFLFGFVNINDYSEKERIKELVDVQNACIKKMHEKLLANTEIERYLHMDMGMELDLEVLRKMSEEYEGTKSLAIREASRVVDVENMKHIAEDRVTIGDEVEKINEEWSNQKEMLSQLLGTDQLPGITPHPKRRERHDELLPADEQQIGDELQHTSFMSLLMGNESPPTNGNLQQPPGEEDQDYDLEYAKDLEYQLFGDML
ncbi:hypothetical protein SOVF_156540 [Spinacia oleracea]|nr:hypothetical protein SOVF_156540 [Spinacia oleracea]